jgi:Glycosyltransferase family 87
MDRDGRARPVSFAVVAVATLTTLALGYLQKAPCLREKGDDGRDFRLMCFTDVEARYGFPGVAAKELPYLETRIEYPVLTGFTVYLASLPSRSGVSFFNWTAAFLTGCSLIVAWGLHKMVGSRALMFAVAPSLLLYAYFNWDVLALSFATLATLAFFRRRDALSGTLLGLGASAKLYPALLVVPFVAARWRDGRRQDAAVLAGTALAAWLFVNLPIALLAPDGWAEFFEVSSARGTDLYSLWAFRSDTWDSSGRRRC